MSGGRNGRRKHHPGTVKKQRTCYLTDRVYDLAAARATRLGFGFSGHVEELILRDLRHAARADATEEE